MGLLLMSYLFFVREGVSFFTYSTTPKFVIVWISAFILYEVIFFFIVKYSSKEKETIPTSLKIINVVIESSFPCILFFLLILVEWSPVFLDSPLLIIYFILIVLSSLHLDVKLGILTGFLTALGYLLVSIWAINKYDPDTEVLNFPPVFYYVRSFFMLITGFCASFVTREINYRIARSFKLLNEKKIMEGLFGQQVSPQVVEALLKNKNTSKKMEVSIMFMDIRNFSAFAESREPEEVIDYQNKLFSPLVEIINRHNGVINQFLGDGFMATFGAPIEDKDHARNALSSGFEILDKIGEMGARGIIPDTRIGLGIHSGEVITGNIGNDMRKQYSISGAPVIIAARLEQLNKDYQTQFLVSREFYERTKAYNISFTRMGEVKVRNIETAIEVYRVDGLKERKSIQELKH